MTAASNCRCDVFFHPDVPWNPPGRSAIAYRAGDFRTFRHALLRPLASETALAAWKPTGEGDLAVQAVEWMAYLADVLTFYNERIANEDYLRTAILPESLTRLIRVLGYRPRPGIGASGTLGALINRPTSTAVPRGLQVQSKPPPGKQPQIFEVDADRTVSFPDAIPFDPPPSDALVSVDDGAPSILLRGVRATVQPSDRLLLLPVGWTGGAGWALATVAAAAQVKDPRGRPATRVSFASAPAVPAGATASGYRALKSTRSARLWTYTAANDVALKANRADLDAVHREVAPSQPVLFEAAGASNPPSPALVQVSGTSEKVWYANAPSANHPETAPVAPAVAVPIPHTRVAFSPSLTGWTGLVASASLSFGWLDVGTPIGTPATALPTTAPMTVAAVAPARFPDVGPGTRVLVEDSRGAGVSALASPGSDTRTLALSDLSPSPAGLVGPFRLLFDLVPVSRGSTVASETLGSGDASVAGQEFVLRKAPVTYLADQDSASGAGYRSTLRLWVDGIQWSEVKSFYGQPPSASIFVTREDEDGRSHVLFGDGVNGARLPTGAGNVTATYRYGSGADVPPAGSLSVIAQPLPNLKTVRNPVPVGGGADPDPPEKIRRYAPRSVLTFDRAVSRDDYETIAAQAPGVARARAYWAWDAAAQRALVTIYVGDDAAAAASARTALAGADDPNRPVLVLEAAAVPLRLTLAVRIAPDYAADPVLASVRSALADPDSGLLGRGPARIGRPLFESQIDSACVDVAGVLAVHGLVVEADRGFGFAAEAGYLIDPGRGGFFELDPADLVLAQER